MLTQDQRTSLAVLGYLQYRMGRFDAARRIYGALLAVHPDDAGPDRLFRQAHTALAAIALEEGKAEGALRHLNMIPDDDVPSTRDAASLLLRARALWALGREDEARNAVQKYMFFCGNRSGSETSNVAVVPLVSPRASYPGNDA